MIKGMSGSRRLAIVLALLVAIMILPGAAPLAANDGTVAIYVQYGDGQVATYCPQATTPVWFVDALIGAEDAGGFVVKWEEYEGLGKALCGIDRAPLGTMDPELEGCEAANCFCNEEAVWNYHYLPAGGEWSWNHSGDMNLQNGDVGAYVFGPWETRPDTLMTFDEICAAPARGGFEATPGTVLLVVGIGAVIAGLAAYAVLRSRSSEKATP